MLDIKIKKSKKDLLKIFIHEKYDLDVGMLSYHLGWSSIAIYFIMTYSAVFERLSEDIFDGNAFARYSMIFVLLTCAILHFENIFFVRKPFLRFFIYTMLGLLGFIIALSIFQIHGVTSIAMMSYLVWFTITPIRKTYQVIIDAKEQFEIEKKYKKECNGDFEI